jgi:hypothetical protein
MSLMKTQPTSNDSPQVFRCEPLATLGLAIVVVTALTIVIVVGMRNATERAFASQGLQQCVVEKIVVWQKECLIYE